MASNPPFQVEDQTDEDFFDKLVNDDDEVMDFKVAGASAGPVFTDGNESDEVKAFANLTITEAKNSDVSTAGIDASVGDSGVESNDKVDMTGENEVKPQVSGSEEPSFEEHNASLASSNLIGFDNVAEPSKGNLEREDFSDSTANKSSGSAVTSGIKEVQWSAFSAAPAENGGGGFGSYSDFFSELGDNAGNSVGNIEDSFPTEFEVPGNGAHESAYFENSDNYSQHQEGCADGAPNEQSTDGQDMNSSQYWENLYPGWKYDPGTGQWYQLDNYDASAGVQGSTDSNSASTWGVSDGKSDISYLQQTAQSVTGTVAESGMTQSVTNWNQDSQANDAAESIANWNQASQASETSGVATVWDQASQVNNGYPSHMVFDPQYPGWYYDTISQEWRTLDTYTSTAQSTFQVQDQLSQNGFAAVDASTKNADQKAYGTYEQVDNYASQSINNQEQDFSWSGSFNAYNQQTANQTAHMWQPGTVARNEPTESQFGSNFAITDQINQQKSSDYRGPVSYYDNASQGQGAFSAVPGSQSFISGGTFSRQFSEPNIEKNEHKRVPSDYFSNQNPVGFSQQPFQGAHQFSYAPTAERSSAGRPPHALVTFGFGGKLIVMKENSSLGNTSTGSQSSPGGSISVLNLMDVVMEKADASVRGVGPCDYFRALCRQSFPGPLTGGSVGSKDLNKWIDERIASSDSSDMNYRKAEVLRLLLSLLKIACQYYGKLRSPFGTDPSLKESDIPETAVAKLFSSAKKNATQYNECGALNPCLQNLPSDAQMRATAAEVQNLLVSGRKREALHCAQEGQLWGPALVLAAQLGDQFYIETVKQMALRQLVAGSPLRTLCLLIAGQPADVFSADTTSHSSIAGAANFSQRPMQFGANGMLDDWEENLAVITANRTKDDELVLIHLGDCLWKERSDIVAAHICYLVAEANFEPYSDSARLCLVGADHWKFPRTYVSPEAIQRTEIYEYSKVLGNSQFTLLPFQPYKLVYAYMLAEVGRTSDSLKYCQAVLKSLKTGRSPEVEALRQLVSSLEERIRAYQQGGFSANLAPGKLVGKLLNLFDSTAHRVVGGLPPPAPSTSGSSVQSDEYNHQPMGPRVSTSQSTMAMSSLMPSASMEPISEWAAGSNKRAIHNRSVSEPDFGRSPRQDHVNSSSEASSTNAQGKASAAGATSRFGRFSFGSQLLQKTVGLVLKQRQDRQAKLGEKNKFYYDEKLKRWVEEGAEPLAEEPPLPPPPANATFQNGISDYNLKNALKSEGSHSNGITEMKSPSSVEHSSGIPPLPPTSNQFSARGRMGVRSRYVDTFNQGGGNPTSLFQSPSIPSNKPPGGATPKFFIPAPASSVENSVENSDSGLQHISANDEEPSVSSVNDSFHSPPPSSTVTMQRYASMDNIANKRIMAVNGSLSAHSRRTASWSGSLGDAFSPPKAVEIKPLGEVLGMPPFMPRESSLVHSSTNGGSFGDDLHEVEL